MITSFRGSAASPGKTLLDVCREGATVAEWISYAAAERLGPEALRKRFPDDFSDCSAEAPAVPYHERSYEDPEAAKLYLEARSVARELLERAVRKMVDEHWIAQARRAGQASSGRIDPTLLLSLNVAIAATTIDIEGVEYLDLTFRPASADRFEELVQIVRDHDLRMDPRVDKIAEFRREVSAVLRKPVPDATFRKAMLEAGIAPRWLRDGKRDLRRTKIAIKPPSNHPCFSRFQL
jgi:hypothetical protein